MYCICKKVSCCFLGEQRPSRLAVALHTLTVTIDGSTKKCLASFSDASDTLSIACRRVPEMQNAV